MFKFYGMSDFESRGTFRMLYIFFVGGGDDFKRHPIFVTDVPSKIGVIIRLIKRGRKFDLLGAT